MGITGLILDMPHSQKLSGANPKEHGRHGKMDTKSKMNEFGKEKAYKGIKKKEQNHPSDSKAFGNKDDDTDDKDPSFKPSHKRNPQEEHPGKKRSKKQKVE
jgi:hypothetical protein